MDKEKILKTELDAYRIVNHFLRKFFNFFKLPEFLPKKWLKKYKHLLFQIFELRKKLEQDILKKDEDLENLNIVEWVDAIEDYIKRLKELLEELTEIDDENKRLVTGDFDSAINDLDETLRGILEMQEAYPWYTGDGTNPVCFININSVNNCKIIVNGVTYTSGVIFIDLAQTVTVTITPNDGYTAESSITPTISGYSGSTQWTLSNGSYSCSLNLTSDYQGSTIYIAYQPTEINYTATIVANVKNAYAYISDNPFTTATITLPYAMKLRVSDYNGYKNGETPTITNYTGTAKWYLSGDDYMFNDTIGVEYADKTLTLNYTAVETEYCTITVNDAVGGYQVYINGDELNSTTVEKGSDISITAYINDGFETEGMPTVTGIDEGAVTITEIYDEETWELQGYQISFNTNDLNGTTAVVSLYAAGSITTDEIRIEWNDNNIYIVEVN